MPRIEVVLVMHASVEVSDEQVQPVRMRIQERLEAITTELDEYGVTYATGNEFRADVREEAGK